MSTIEKPAGAPAKRVERRHRVSGLSRFQSILRGVVLAVGAVVFLFPFYYMVVGALQTKPDPTLAGAFPNPANLSLDNFVNVNERINLASGLINSGIFTGGVLLCTVVFGVLVGYALAMLQWRGRSATFALVLLVQVIPFQLLQIPLYVLIARDYGLADTHVGMILPFAINSTAVIIFRQYFLQLPKELFEAARIDGAGELRLLWSVALPLVRPALVTAVLLTFIGPWNEFLWPFLITKDASLQPLAVSLANYISTVAASTDNPFGAILAGAVVLAAPVVVLFIVFQRYFVSSDLGSGVKG
ncbi:carbohydrate ABC transporter permease [Herbiconiux liangxiaofengii]|uniref:carbohydrate ABC transporter permease n=1 Tax=Herbiconiux liangxiaofengii TaxID=3342795 RepID=UPI0035BB1CB9